MFMFMKMFLSLGLGYVLCVLANKEKGIMKTLGFTLGISILVLSLAYGLLESRSSCGMMSGKCPMMGKMGNCSMMKHHPMVKH